jgi:hypothetical protein
MSTLYTAGYLIRVTSWENDGDAYNTAEVNVSSKDVAYALTQLALLFKSTNTSDGIGNMYEPSEDGYNLVVETLYAFHKKYGNILEVSVEDEEDITDAYIGIASDLGLVGSEFYTRVCEQVSVYYLPQDVIVQEVTEQFTS